MNHLREQSKKNESKFYDVDKVFFFGLYESKPETFKFLPGETILIQQISEEVRNIVDRDGLNRNLSEFIPPKQFQVSRKDTCQLFGCTFFGKKVRKQKRTQGQLDFLLDVASESEPNGAPTVKSELKGLKSELIPKLKAQFELKDPSLKGRDYFSENMVELKNDGKRFVALAECIFCYAKTKQKKKVTIQFAVAKNDLPYWNFSNLRRHFKLHSIEMDSSTLQNESPSKSRLATPDLISVQSVEETSYKILYHKDNDPSEDSLSFQIDVDDENMIEISDEDALNTSSVSAEEILEYEMERIVDTTSVEYQIFEQMSNQNLFLTKAVHTHNETTHSMSFILNDKPKHLRVIKIIGDGSCMFGCLVNQLFGFKVKSSEHEEAVSSLRALTVDFIQSNFEDFRSELKGRVLDEREENQKNKIKRKNKKWEDVTENDCKFFKLESLSEYSTYGGVETAKAISKIYSVNILVFNESGTHYFPLGFNPSYGKIVFMAYRLSPKSEVERNHYDSVAEVDLSILCDCVSFLCGIASKKDELAGTNNTLE